MDWTWFLLGIVFGALVTSALAWNQRGTSQQAVPPGYFTRVTYSIIATAVVAGLISVGVDYASTGQFSAMGVWLGGGWLIGGLLAAWALTYTK